MEFSNGISVFSWQEKQESNSGVKTMAHFKLLFSCNWTPVPWFWRKSHIIVKNFKQRENWL